MPRRPRRIAAVLLLAVVAWLAAGAVGAAVAVAPRHRAVATPARIAGIAPEPLRLHSDDGVALAAWWVDAGGDRAVALFAGIGGDRSALVGRAALWVELGWSALMLDLRGTGESGGDRVTFGWGERRDVVAAVAHLEQRGARRIAVHGVSLGAAAIAFAADEIAPRLDRAVLEMPYRDLDTALSNRLPWVPWPELALWPLRACGAGWIGRDPGALRPVDAVAALAAPTLILAGGRDPKATPAEVRDLAAAIRAPVTLEWFPGAVHQDLLRHEPARFRGALARFAVSR